MHIAGLCYTIVTSKGSALTSVHSTYKSFLHALMNFGQSLTVDALQLEVNILLVEADHNNHVQFAPYIHIHSPLDFYIRD